MEIGVRKIQKVNFEGEKKNQCENLLYIMSLCDCRTSASTYPAYKTAPYAVHRIIFATKLFLWIQYPQCLSHKAVGKNSKIGEKSNVKRKGTFLRTSLLRISLLNRRVSITRSL